MQSLTAEHEPYFAPVFDTARGLFWNDSEQKIVERVRKKQNLKAYLHKYIVNSYPKTGWEGESNLNHIELVKRIHGYKLNYAEIINDLLTEEKEQQVMDMLRNNFSVLLSVERLYIITECLKLRFKELREIVQIHHAKQTD